MDKSLLRQELKTQRLQMASQDAATASQRIINVLLQRIDWRTVRSLHCFLPLAALNEIDTQPLFEHLWSNFPTIETYTSLKDGSLRRVLPGFVLEMTEPENFEVIIVPMLGFDDSLHRIGYGGGFYDRFLSTQYTSRKIGVCYAIGKRDELPHEPHDIPLDMVITEG